jgi:hypothetical protein
MRIVLIVAALFVAAFMFGQCAGRYTNNKTANNNPFERRVAVEQQ